MKILETILNKYFQYSDLFLIIVLFLQILLTIRIYSRHKALLTKRIFFQIIEKIYLSTIIAIVSFVLPCFKLKLELKCIYLNVLFFIGCIFFIASYTVINMLKHRERLNILCHYIGYAPIAIWFQFLLLGVFENLEFLELLNGLTAICLIELAQTVFKQRIATNETIDNIRPGINCSNKDLYGTRKRQMDRFAKIIKEQMKEPYAIMISGEWGCGKTSFIDALEETLSTDVFIRVNTGGEKDASEIMKDISNEIIHILKDNYIFLETSGLIENYFLSFTQMLDEAGFGFFQKLLESLGLRPKESLSKKYVNSKLKKLANLGKSIYLIIDDLDRCTDEYRMKMFKVIRESTDLTNCKTIFLADDTIFMTNDCNVNYIEKYISYNLRLCKVEYEEIVKYHFLNLFDNHFQQSINKEILHELTLTDLYEEVLCYPDNISKQLEGATQTKNVTNEEINDITSTLYQIEKNVINSRKVIHFLNGIRNDLLHLSNIWGVTANEYKAENWINSILKAEFVKHILSSDYIDMMGYSNIWSYLQHSRYSMNRILSDSISFPKNMELLNYALYKLDTLDFTTDMSDRETALKELKSEKANIEHFQIYLEYMSVFNDYKYYNKLLELYNDGSGLTEQQRLQFFEQLLHNISIYQIPLTKDYLILSRRITKLLTLVNWSDSEFKTINVCIKNIVDTCIASNILTLKKPLYVYYDYIDIEERWTSSVSDIKELYNALYKIDSSYFKAFPEYRTRQLDGIQQYYENMQHKLLDQQDEYTLLDIKSLLSKCRLLFQICQVWVEVPKIRELESTKKDGIRYFDSKLFIWDNRTFSSVENLMNALDNFEEYLKSPNSIYPADSIMLFQKLVIDMLNRIRQSPDWYKGQALELLQKLDTIMNILCQLDLQGNTASIEMLETLKILVYDYRRHCSE